MAEPVLTVENLFVQRGERLLIREFSFLLNRGEIVHLSGTNGSGKTSLLRVLSGLSHPMDGKVTVEKSCRVIYLGHALGVKPELTVTENLNFLLKASDLKQKIPIEDALKAVGLARYFDITVGTLSAGQKKRVGLARLLIEPTNLWLLDEPFSALDSRSCHWLCDRIDDFVNQGGAVLYTSHQPVKFKSAVRELDLGGY